MSTEIFLQTTENPEIFELVDHFILTNREKCLLEDGTPRYTDNYVVLEETGEITLSVVSGTRLTLRTLSIISRIAGCRTDYATNNIPNGGFVHHPTHIKLRQRKKEVLYEIGTGKVYK